MEFGFSLPFPPSVNHTWMRGAGKRLYSNPKVKAFHKESDCILQEVKRLYPAIEFPIQNRLQVVIVLNERDKRRRDIDNYQKSVMDACTKCGIWDDDSQVDELIIRRGIINKDNPNVFITISEVFIDE